MTQETVEYQTYKRTNWKELYRIMAVKLDLTAKAVKTAFREAKQEATREFQRRKPGAASGTNIASAAPAEIPGHMPVTGSWISGVTVGLIFGGMIAGMSSDKAAKAAPADPHPDADQVRTPHPRFDVLYEDDAGRLIEVTNRTRVLDQNCFTRPTTAIAIRDPKHISGMDLTIHTPADTAGRPLTQTAQLVLDSSVVAHYEIRARDFPDHKLRSVDGEEHARTTVLDFFIPGFPSPQGSITLMGQGAGGGNNIETHGAQEIVIMNPAGKPMLTVNIGNCTNVTEINQALTAVNALRDNLRFSSSAPAVPGR